jgi:hypothetical protein
MRKLLVALVLICSTLSTAEARRHSQYPSWDTGSGSSSQYERVEGYQKRDGTTVEPYYRTKSDSTLDNNYSTRGNENPWTGKKGTGDTDYDKQQKSWGLENR